jgi:hypothetical protein
MPSIPAFFAIFVPLIFYAIGVLVNLLISSSFEEEHFYLGVELTLGSLASSLTYIYGLVKENIEKYENQVNVTGSDVAEMLKNL